MGLTLFRRVPQYKYLFLAIFVALLIFAPSLLNFFSADDWFHLRVSKISTVGEFVNFFSFSQSPQFAGSYRPLSTQIFFFVFQSVFGLNPLPYHLFVWLVFAMVLYLLFVVLREISGSWQLAMIAVFIYAVSATNFTRLYFISTFQEILMIALILGAMLFYLRSYGGVKRARNYAVACSFFALALACKETAIVFPGVLFLLDWFKRRLSLKRLLPVMLIALVYGYLRFVKLGGAAGDSYIWDFSINKVGNSLMWYGLWSLGLPEFLVDYVGSGFRILPKFFVDFLLMAWSILIMSVLTVISFGVLVVGRLKGAWRKVVLGAGIFVGSLLPVIFLPWHKFTLELGLPMVGVAFITGSVLRKKSLVGGIFICFYILMNLLTNYLYLTRHYSVTRARISQKVYDYFARTYPVPLVGSYFEFINDTSDYGPQWGSSKQVAQATADSNLFKVIYKDPSYEVYFEDYPGPRPLDKKKIAISTKMFTE